MEETQKESTGVGGMKITTTDVFTISEEEQKELYLRIAFLSLPTLLRTRQSDLDSLYILYNELGKIVKMFNRFNSATWIDWMVDIQKINGLYLLESSNSRKDKLRMIDSITTHLNMLAAIGKSLPAMKKLEGIYTRHYNNVSNLIAIEKQKQLSMHEDVESGQVIKKEML